jgi:integrase
MRLGRLSARFVQTAKPRKHPYADGGCLYLDASASKDGDHVNRSWLFIYAVPGSSDRAKGVRSTVRSMGLGALADVSIKEARQRAHESRELLRRGHDPLDERDRQRRANIAARETRVLFRTEAEAFVELHAPGWSPASLRDWKRTLAKHVYPRLGGMPVSDITSADVIGVIEPLWVKKTVTAGRCLNQIQRILAHATVRQHRHGDDPCAGVRDALPKASVISPVTNLAALDYRQVPDLMARLAAVDTVASRALRFLILVAGRSGEIMGATWEEIDTANALWTIPGARMKRRRQHRVPLSEPALACLTAQPALRRTSRGGLKPQVLQHCKTSQQTSQLTTKTGRVFDIDAHGLRRELVRLGIEGATVHGFRSAFKTWCDERTSYARNPVELCLAHKVAKDDSEEAYKRGDMLDTRREILNAWSRFCLSPPAATATGDNVVAIGSR